MCILNSKCLIKCINEKLIDFFHCFIMCRYVCQPKLAERREGDHDPEFTHHQEAQQYEEPEQYEEIEHKDSQQHEQPEQAEHEEQD